LTWGGDLESKATHIWAECLDAHGAEPAAGTNHDRVDTPAKIEALLREVGFHSPRAWTDDLVCTLDAEHLIRLRTGLGAIRARYESLAPAAREACVADARRRMKSLTPADFEARGRVVYAVANV
jgi:hypothetical protein